MKLIFLIPYLHPWGTERVAVLMANHYAAKGFETTLLSVARPGGDFRFKIDPRVKIDSLNIRLESGWNLIRKIESFFAIRRYVKRYLRSIQDEPGEPGAQAIQDTQDTQDTQVAQYPYPGGINHIILLGMGNFPIILAATLPAGNHLRTIGCMHTPYKALRHIWKFMRWLMYRRLNMLVTLTHRDLPRLAEHNPNVRVIPNPVTFYPEHTSKLESKLILAIGRMDYLKGYDLMLEVFERFCRKNNDWKLKIIGEGPLKSQIEQLSADKGLTGRLIFAPATRHIEEEYHNASIYLMTSRQEGLPMVLLEAQACGLPIVAFDCETGPAEIIYHGTDGYLVKPWDIEAMSEHLLELAENRDLRKAFGACGRENVKRFLPDKIFTEWDELFDSL